MSNPKKAYASAGVDVDLGNTLKRRIQNLVKSTHGPAVLGKIGGFGGLFRASFPGIRQPVLVASIDGVGTKIKIAIAANRHHTIGQDLVNHCINDIAVVGAKPLFFLDYIAAAQLEPAIFSALLRGLSKACKAAGCALIGGETAQMPGLYQPGDYDLAGCIVGVAPRTALLDGSKIRPGDILLGLPSNGLHTNGYSLARKILFEIEGRNPADPWPNPSSRRTLADELLRIHKNYQPLLAQLPAGTLKAAAHITGGGLLDNLPRILPDSTDAVINTSAWRVPHLFRHLQQAGKVEPEEMFQVFNMGIGMVVIVSPDKAANAAKSLKAIPIGSVQRGHRKVRLLFPPKNSHSAPP